jgi:hypothetical protein
MTFMYASDVSTLILSISIPRSIPWVDTGRSPGVVQAIGSGALFVPDERRSGNRLPCRGVAPLRRGAHPILRGVRYRPYRHECLSAHGSQIGDSQRWIDVKYRRPTSIIGGFQEAPRTSPTLLEAHGSSRKPPGSSPDLLEASVSFPDLTGASRTSRDLPPRSRELPGSSREYQELPGPLRSFQEAPGSFLDLLEAPGCFLEAPDRYR